MLAWTGKVGVDASIHLYLSNTLSSHSPTLILPSSHTHTRSHTRNLCHSSSGHGISSSQQQQQQQQQSLDGDLLFDRAFFALLKEVEEQARAHATAAFTRPSGAGTDAAAGGAGSGGGGAGSGGTTAGGLVTGPEHLPGNSEGEKLRSALALIQRQQQEADLLRARAAALAQDLMRQPGGRQGEGSHGAGAEGGCAAAGKDAWMSFFLNSLTLFHTFSSHKHTHTYMQEAVALEHCTPGEGPLLRTSRPAWRLSCGRVGPRWRPRH
jgi:hypothetical protein